MPGSRRVTLTCSLCGWRIAGPCVTSAMEAAIRSHMEELHAPHLPAPGFGRVPRLADILRHFRLTSAHGAASRRSAP
jgi:hypothetical protein